MKHEGSCMCGAVRFEVEGPLKPPDACHCTQCCKQSGHYFASTDFPRSALRIHGEDKVTWYRSSERVRRGFCSICGSSLFFDPIHRDWTSVAMGALDTPSQTRLHMHIFVSEKGDYYEIADGLPQNAR